MRSNRRTLLKFGGAIVGATALAGCTVSSDDGNGGTPDQSGTAGTANPEAADVAVAAEWNAMGARVRDALALGTAGSAGAGASVARRTFARFEEAHGEHGAHEMLETTSEPNYAEFEEALGELRTEGLGAGDLGRAREEVIIAGTQLREAKRELVGEALTGTLDLQLLGAAALDARFLADAEAVEAAGTVAEDVLDRFEEAPVHDALESGDPEAYEAFEAGLGGVVSAADAGDLAGIRTSATDAYRAAIEGSYTLAGSAEAAGSGHVAALQARGWDAAALASMGGPSTNFAHAVSLSVYRARAYDARWLAARGETETAATMAGDVFAHFEGAKAHEALEETDHDAYEGFEAGLSDLRSAIEAGESGAIDAAAARVDENLVSGIEALGGANAPLLESGFFRTRFADALELYELGGGGAAATIARGLFERFEENELDFHETVESTSEDLYHRFEEEHLPALIEAFEGGNDGDVATHYEGVQTTLLEFETAAGSPATVSGAEGVFVAGRGFDAAAVDALGNAGRARTIAQGTFEHFETGAGGYHEALERADESTYESFEEALGAISTAAAAGEAVYPKAKAYNAEVVASVYAVVGNAGGSNTNAAATLLQDVFADFEEARVHELLEDGDQAAYEAFEAKLGEYVTALQEGGHVWRAASAFADASLRAQFAVVGAVDSASVGASEGEGVSDDGGHESGLQGGPNVVEGVPDDADHVVDMNAVSFAPEELTVEAGETVAWTHAGGEAHTVTAYDGGVPDGADYWASGDFGSQGAAEQGWVEGQGAVKPGQSYVHTFEAAGTYEYYCVPHEAAGMTGTVVVEQ